MDFQNHKAFLLRMRIGGRILPALLIFLAAAVLAAALRLCFTDVKFDVPVAFACKDGLLYVVENEKNTVLVLSGMDAGNGLKLEERHPIEHDDDRYFYSTIHVQPVPDGIIVESCLYGLETKEFSGYRLAKYSSFGAEPRTLFTFITAGMKPDPDFYFHAEDDGDLYVLTNCPGRRSIMKIPVSAQPAVMEKAELPPGVLEIGGQNTESTGWMGFTRSKDGRFFAASADSGKIIEYSPEGAVLGELGAVGFGKDDLLAPGNVFFAKIPPSSRELLTVANKGNRNWIQFDSAGRTAGTVAPLESGYQFPDILVNRIYNGKDGAAYSFDLANGAFIGLSEGGVTTCVTEYSERRIPLFAAACALALVLLACARRHRAISAAASRLRFPFVAKLIVVFIPMLAGSCWLVGIWTSKIFIRNLQEESFRRSANIAHAILSGIDPADFSAVDRPEDRGGEAYERIYGTAKRICELSKVEYTPQWILHKIRQGRYYFGINNWRGPIFEPFIVPKERRIFFDALRQKTPQSGTYRDDQGEWSSYVVPVADQDGKVINVLELYRSTDAQARIEAEIRTKVARVMAGVSVFAIAAIVGLSFFFTRPLKKLIQGTRIVSRGGFDHRIDVRTRDELADLAESFNQMGVDLRKYIDDLARETSLKEKMESELRIAHDIQMSIVPNTFPAFPNRPEFDIHAMLIPAKAVGGDLYDFFFIDDRHLCFAIGDVSGKGVPASLFMAVTRTLLRAKAFSCLDTGRIIAEMNKDLCADNGAMMFVTFFLCILDIGGGGIVYTNAGHNPPFILRKDGKLEPLNKKHGTPLGVDDSQSYGADSVRLEKGDSIVLYTDGVTEAFDAGGRLYEEAGLTKSMLKAGGLKPEDAIKLIYGDLAEFTRGAEQADDITIVALKIL